MNGSIREWVARAICADCGVDPDATDGLLLESAQLVPDVGEPNWYAYEPLADAAIAAHKAALAAAGLVIVTREPSEAMIRAGKQVVFSVLLQTVKPEQIKSLLYTGIQEWRAMVAACKAEADLDATVPSGDPNQ